MSLNNLSDLSWLLLIVDRYYSEGNAIALFGWDFKQEKLQPADAGDGLARFLAAELQDTFDPAQSKVEQVINGAGYIQAAIKELQVVSDGMEDYAVNLIVRDFVHWMVVAKRQNFSEGLLQSWLDVHPLPAVRDLADQVKKRMQSILPGGNGLAADKIAFMTQAVDDLLKVGEGLDEILKEEVAPATGLDATAPPATPLTS